MTIEEMKNRFCYKIKVYLRDPETGEPTEEYIILREPNSTELAKLTDNEQENNKIIMAIMPNCIVDSSITDETGNKVKNKQISDIIMSTTTLATDVMNDWLKACPFSSRKRNEEN